ncbi:sialic acid-binding Ig-like lectin 5 [Thomomys bottae]
MVDVFHVHFYKTSINEITRSREKRKMTETGKEETKWHGLQETVVYVEKYDTFLSLAQWLPVETTGSHLHLGLLDQKGCKMGALLLLLPLLWAGSLQEDSGLNLQVPEQVTVQEGLCVLVPCTFSYPWHKGTRPLYIYWFKSEYKARLYPVATNNPQAKVETGTQDRFQLLKHSTGVNCSLSIRDARLSDTGSYFFQVQEGASAKYTYRDRRLNLEVTALTEKPVIHSRTPLQSGCPTQLTCSLPGSCQGGRPLTFSWIGDALKSVNPRKTHTPVLTFTPQAEDHNTSLTCRVELQGTTTTERTILLNVSYPPQLLGPTCSWGAEGLHCTCASRTWPAPTLQWWLGEELLDGDIGNASVTITSSSEGLWANSSLSLHKELGPNLRLSCEARNVHGAQSAWVLLLPGKLASKAGSPQALAALGGAGATALLCLCLCLVFFCIVKMRRPHATGRPQGMDGEDPVMGTVSWVSDQDFFPRGCPLGYLCMVCAGLGT